MIDGLRDQMQRQGGAITGNAPLMAKWLDTDPAKPKVLGVELEMTAEVVIKVLENDGIKDIKMTSGTNPSLPKKQFILQSESLVQAVEGGVVFYFDDGRKLTRIYTNAKRLAIRSSTGDNAKVGDNRLAFDKCLNKNPKTETLPSKILAATYGVSGVKFIVIYPKLPGPVVAWSIENR